MLLTVEGGGFFSSSALGYSKGIKVLLLGQKAEERPMRVSPFQLPGQEICTDTQLASKGNQVSRGCASLICFGCTSTGVNGPSPLRVGPENQTESLSSADIDACPEPASDNLVACSSKPFLRSSLKKPPTESSALPAQVVNTDDSLREESSSGVGCVESRKVQWSDAFGEELVQIKEFEVSDDDLSDDEFGQNIGQKCRCVIQ